MEIPKFLVGDNTECQDSVFIIHTESPRFILNLDTDDVKWLDDDLLMQIFPILIMTIFYVSGLGPDLPVSLGSD